MQLLTATDIIVMKPLLLIRVRANAIFGKIGRFASEEVTLHLLKTKCIPVLLYGLEALPLNKSQIASIDFVIDSS